MVSPRPSCISAPVSMIDSPPSWRMPTSNETRVRVEGFSKIIASVLPSSGFGGFSPGFFFAFSLSLDLGLGHDRRRQEPDDILAGADREQLLVAQRRHQIGRRHHCLEADQQ